MFYLSGIGLNGTGLFYENWNGHDGHSSIWKSKQTIGISVSLVMKFQRMGQNNFFIEFCEYLDMIRGWQKLDIIFLKKVFGWFLMLKVRENFGTFGTKNTLIYFLYYFMANNLTNFDPPLRNSITESTLICILEYIQ